MHYNHNTKLTPLAQNLRKNMTKEERKLWYKFLKFLPFTIRRQKNIGNYIVDFYCAETKTVIELDGSQHYEELAMQKDRERDKFLLEQGITVLRYSNDEVNLNFDGVCVDILTHFNLSENI